MTLARSDLVAPIAAGARALTLRRRAQREHGSRFMAYTGRPYEFVVECLRESAWSKQRDIMESVRLNRHTAVKACHGPGKSFIAARIVAWWLSCHAPGEAFVVTSAPTAPQVRAILWREIGRAYQRGQLPGRVNQTEWWMPTGVPVHYLRARTGEEELVAFGRKPANPAGAQEADGLTVTAFQGIHAKYVLVVLDEADGIPESLYNAAESLATNDGCRILAIGNPDHGSSAFAAKCKPNTGWNVITISAFDTPNFTGEEVPPEVAAVLVDRKWVEEARDRWGEGSPLYLSKVMGEFPEDDSAGVIPWSWLDRCRGSRVYVPADLVPVELGMDVGASAGGDWTVIRERRGLMVGRTYRAHTPESSQAVALAMTALRETGATKIKIDATGVGWGVAGRLNELKREHAHAADVVPLMVGGAPRDREKFANMRAEIWWMARELTQGGEWDLSAVDDDTLAQLSAPRWTTNAVGKVQIEPKDETIKRVGHSPDDADALNLAFYTPPGSGWAEYARESVRNGHPA